LSSLCYECKKAIESIEGVSSSEVSIGSAKVIYDESKTDRGQREKAVHRIGYKRVS